MGYYTYFAIDWEVTDEKTKNKCECSPQVNMADLPHGSKYCPVCGNTLVASVSDSILEWLETTDNFYMRGITEGDSMKWYHHEADMKNFSKLFPQVIFTLSGEGEEGGDLWRKYFFNGKMQIAEAHITYEEFDESKLK